MAADLPERVFSGAEGNPLFVEELVRMLATSTTWRRTSRGLGVRELSALSVPPTIHALLAARLDRLDPARARRGRGRRGGRAGRSAAEPCSSWAAAADRAELDRHLGALVRKQLIEPDGGRFAGEETFSFKHILVRDVAYQGILKELRADLHERFADWLEREAGERAGEYEEILGYHLERAYRYLTGARADRRARPRAGRPGRRPARIVRAAAPWPAATSGPPSACSSGRCRCCPRTIPPGATYAQARDRAGRDRPADAARTRCSTTGSRPSGAARAFVVFHDRSREAARRRPRRREATITVGRRADNDVALSWDNEVSRRHAQLLRAAEGWVLVDDGSRNGSYLNGERVTGAQPLRDGDVLRFGDTVVLVPGSRRGRGAAAGDLARARAGDLMGAPAAGRRGTIMRERVRNPVSELKARIEAERTGHAVPALQRRRGQAAALLPRARHLTQASVGRRASVGPRARLGRPGLAPPRPVRAGRARTGRSSTTASRATAPSSTASA